MLVALRSRDSTRVHAWEEAKTSAPWVCPECSGGLILKKGPIKVDHFAHKTSAICAYGEAESEEHYRCKISIYTELRNHPGVSFCAVEHTKFKIVRPDVFVVFNNEQIAIEVQRSNLSEEKIEARTAAYASLGVSVLWVCLWSDRLEKMSFSPSAWSLGCTIPTTVGFITGNRR